MLRISEFEAAVTGIENFSEDGRIIARIIKAEKPAGFVFMPGQFVMITMEGYEPGNNWNRQLWRAYSVCSSPQQPWIELCFTVKEPPSFTHFLDGHIGIGKKLRIKGPYGGFGLKEGAGEIIFIAAGTGIAPIVSMIRELKEKSRKISLFYGYRNRNQFYYGEEFAKLAEESGDFHFSAIASREGENRGHVQKLLEDSRFSGNDADVYICGPPKMVDESKAIMLKKGFAGPRMHAEKYD